MADTAVVGSLTRVEQKVQKVQKVPDPGEAIANERFIRQLDQLRELKEFLFEEKVRFKEEDLRGIDLEELNNLSYSASGRVPSADEWRTLDEKLATLAAYLGDDLRRKIRIRELGLFFKTLPMIFLVMSVVATLLYVTIDSIDKTSGSSWRLLVWLAIVSTWSISQGGLGACAFLGTSVIMKTAILNEPTPQQNIDLTDRNFLLIRVILGAIFAVLLGLRFAPFGLNVFKEVYYSGSETSSEASLILSVIPFLAGFSTNLVLVILGKFIVAIESIFGTSGRT